MTRTYDLLSRDMRKYIYEKGWPSLTKIQEAAIKHMNLTDNNLILAAPTASGKTEAAFLPAISKSKDIKDKLRILYISPLIALINDQFKRISNLCKDLDISVTRWHSESSISRKNKLIKDPSGILLITPESLEAMLVSDKNRAEILLKDIDFVIVDEIHGFLNTNRGLQLKSLLTRIRSYSENNPRMIGLSATIGDKNFDLAKKFFLNDRDTNILLDRSKNDLIASLSYIESEDINEKIGEKVLALALGKSTLIFPNSRDKVEKLAYLLKKEVEEKSYDLRIFSHHSSISKLKRTEIENFAKTSKENFIIVATSTLELGIDIGAVDQVIQIGSPDSVLSLSQRLGRSGRREKKSVIHQIATDKWDLVQSLACLELFKEDVLDKMRKPVKSFDIFAHQVLSTLLEKNGLTKDSYYRLNKSLKAFSDITDKEFEILTRHMVDKGFIEEIDGEYIVGIEAEKLMTMGSFYNQFVAKKTYQVQTDKHLIGDIDLAENLKIKDRIYLAGEVWKIETINHKSRKISVIKSDKANQRSFEGSGSFEISGEVRKKMEDILVNKTYKNLGPLVVKSLDEMTMGLDRAYYHFITEDGERVLRTFQSTRVNKTLALMLNIRSGSLSYHVEDMSSIIKGPKIYEDFLNLRKKPVKRDELTSYLEENPKLSISLTSLNKFMALVPDSLKAIYVSQNILDFSESLKYLQNL